MSDHDWPAYAARFQAELSDSYWNSAREYAVSVADIIRSEKFLKGAVIGTSVAVIVSAVVGPYFYTSVPDGLYPEDKWTIRRIYARNQYAGLLAKIGAKMGFGKPMDINRRLRDRITTRVKKNPNVFVEHLHFDGVPVVLYRKQLWNINPTDSNDQPEKRPAVVHIYGGGWSFCTSKTYEPHHRLLTEKLDAVILTVDYRKAPENPFPAPFDDCYKAVKYLHEHAEDYSVDPNRISILGDSAGANIAAAVALKLRDDGQAYALKNQLLIYPCTQFTNFRTNSYLSEFPLLTPTTMATFVSFYAGEKPAKIGPGLLQNYHVSQAMLDSSGWRALQKYVSHHPTVYDSLATEYGSFQGKAMNAYMCPLMAESMKDLPPTLIMICQFDVLKDDGLAYMDRLQADGVPVGLKVYPGTHGTFRYFEELKAGKEMMRDVIDYFRAKM